MFLNQITKIVAFTDATFASLTCKATEKKMLFPFECFLVLLGPNYIHKSSASLLSFLQTEKRVNQ